MGVKYLMWYNLEIFLLTQIEKKVAIQKSITPEVRQYLMQKNPVF